MAVKRFQLCSQLQTTYSGKFLISQSVPSVMRTWQGHCGDQSANACIVIWKYNVLWYGKLVTSAGWQQAKRSLCELTGLSQKQLRWCSSVPDKHPPLTPASGGRVGVTYWMSLTLPQRYSCFFVKDALNYRSTCLKFAQLLLCFVNLALE